MLPCVQQLLPPAAVGMWLLMLWAKSCTHAWQQSVDMSRIHRHKEVTICKVMYTVAVLLGCVPVIVRVLSTLTCHFFALYCWWLQHYKPVQAAAKWLEAVATTGYRYLGLDTSVAPGLDTPPLTASYECLGVCDKFGGPGTLSISAMITGVLKSLQPLQLTGYCGLMLAVCEDQVKGPAWVHLA